MSALLAGHLDPADDLPQIAPNVAGWTENYQWYAVESSGLGVMAHIGTMPGAPDLWHAVFALVTPAGETLMAKSIGRAPDAGTVGTGNGWFRCHEPFERWTCSFRSGMRVVTEAEMLAGCVTDGAHVPVTIELDLRSAAVWNPTGSAAHPEWGGFHHEQSLTAVGTIAVGGTSYEINGFGHRDHSAGPRDLSQLRRAMWANASFPSGWSFATMWAVRSNGEEVQRAAVCRHGQYEDVELETVSTITDAAAHPRHVALRLRTALGTIDLMGTVLAGANFTVAGPAEWCIGTELGSPSAYVLTHRFTRWEVEGEVAHGFLDRGARSDELRAGRRNQR